MKKLGEYPETIRRSAENFDASVIAVYIYDVAKLFSKFYQECPILGSDDENLKRARLTLASATLRVLKEAMGLVLVPYLDRM